MHFPVIPLAVCLVFWIALYHLTSLFWVIMTGLGMAAAGLCLVVRERHADAERRDEWRTTTHWQ